MCIPRSRKPSASYHRLESVDSLPPPAPRPITIPFNIANMGPPPAMPSPGAALRNPSSTHISAQHERLILELLPFKDAAKFHEWLQGEFVRGSWIEFCRDHLAQRPGIPGPVPGMPEPDKAKTAQAAKDAISSRSKTFLLYHPNKSGWTSDDHHVRFIVTVIQDNMLKNPLWSESDWKKRGIDIAKAVFEVLCFLKASFYMMDQHPPVYTQ